MDAKHISLGLLNESHSFPGPFVFKLIGANTEAFATAAREAIARVVAPTDPGTPFVRRSTHGEHQALTFTVQAASAEQVLAVYEALKNVPGTRFVL